MKTVWVVSAYYLEDWWIVGVFSSHYKADKYVREHEKTSHLHYIVSDHKIDDKA